MKLSAPKEKYVLKSESCDPLSIERGVRQLLANKVSGNMFGLWLLIPEHIRLGTWDLLNSWTDRSRENEEQVQQVTEIDSRLAMQLINEASLCVPGVRENVKKEHSVKKDLN